MVAHGKPVTYFIAACGRDFLALGHIDNLLLRFGGVYMYSIFIHSKLQLCSPLRILNIPHRERRLHATPPSVTFTQVMNLVDKAGQHGYVGMESNTTWHTIMQTKINSQSHNKSVK